MNNDEMIKKMNDELFESEKVDKEFFVLSLIKDYFERKSKEEDNEVVKGLQEYENPLQTAYEVFNSYVDLEKVFDKVFKDFFVKGQSHREIIADCMYCDQFYDEDEFCEETDEDDEGIIHDNEDC